MTWIDGACGALVELLLANESPGTQAPSGIPTVFGTFREALHKQRCGSKNPAKDLGILLDLYEQWQKQVFPHTDFDKFAQKVSGLYGKPGGKSSKGATLKVSSTFAQIRCLASQQAEGFVPFVATPFCGDGLACVVMAVIHCHDDRHSAADMNALQGDMRELRESVIQVALDNMISRQDGAMDRHQDNEDGPSTSAPLDWGEQGVDALDTDAQTTVQHTTVQSNNPNPFQEVPLNTLAPRSTGVSDVHSQAAENGCVPDDRDREMDPDELMQLQPEAWEECDDLDDMMVMA